MFLCRKRRVSPGSRSKPPAGKRKQKSKAVCVEREEREEESDSEMSTPEPLAGSTASRLAAIPVSSKEGSSRDSATSR